MSRLVAVRLVTVCILAATIAASARAAGEGKTGSIKGEVTVSGVRSPENLVVYIDNVPGEYPPPAEPAEVDQKKLVFIPHVLPVVKGTTVVFKNGDPLLHNVFWPASDDGSYPPQNLGTWGQGDSRSSPLTSLATWYYCAISMPRWRDTL